MPAMAVSSDENIQAPLINVTEETVLPPTYVAANEEDTMLDKTPAKDTPEETPRSSPIAVWHPRRLSFVEGQCQFQVMAEGIERLCTLFQNSQAENFKRTVITKTLVLCEKATSPEMPKLVTSKIEQWSAPPETVAAPPVPQPMQMSRWTQTESGNLRKSHVVIESFPPRNNVDSSDESIPSTTLSHNSNIMDRIADDFDMSFESEDDQSIELAPEARNIEDVDEGLGQEYVGLEQV
jgi:hypothetical protein